jgi:hypothetical protein
MRGPLVSLTSQSWQDITSSSINFTTGIFGLSRKKKSFKLLIGTTLNLGDLHLLSRSDF